MNKGQINRISGIILDCSIEIHKNLGPGLLESVYEICLYKELKERGLHFNRQLFLPVNYKGELLMQIIE
jgi:GxxExxY protein